MWETISSIPDSKLQKAHNIIKEKEHEKISYKINICNIGDAKLFLVDGNKMEALLSTDFTCGGSDMSYGKKSNVGEGAFIPDGEIWVDGKMDTTEIRFISYHEAVERFVMINYDMSYEKAHEIANEMEKEKRKNMLKK